MLSSSIGIFATPSTKLPPAPYLARAFMAAALILGTTGRTFAQSVRPAYDDPQRPKVALVLGGGGARGAAHAGVLKVLEENNVPIDFIVGTSMGSIVGGLYASGLSPEEIEALFNEIDWKDLFSDRPKASLLSFRNKADYARLANIELGVRNGKIVLPNSIVGGQKLEFMLNKVLLHTHNVDNFDDLRIPFRAVAADAETGELVIFDRGPVAQAIRSSMSVPGAFPPVEVNGRLLIDGGVVMNVPVEIAKKMGADIIIAVDVSTKPGNRDQLNSVVGVTHQMITLLFNQNVKYSLSLLNEQDLLITPDINDATSNDFVRTPEIIKMGEATARQMADRIRRYSVTAKSYDLYLAQQRQKERPLPVIDYVQVKDSGRVNPKLVRNKISVNPGEPLDTNALEKDLTAIYAMEDFQTVGFDIEKKDGQKGLLVDATPKSWGPNYLHLGLNLQSDSDGNNDYDLILDYRMTQLNDYGGELKMIGKLGQVRGLFTEFYQPVSFSENYFIAPFANLEKRYRYIYSQDRRVAEYELDEISGGVDFGTTFHNAVEARIGTLTALQSAKPSIGDSGLPTFDDNLTNALTSKFLYESLDDYRFPTEGSSLRTLFVYAPKELGSDIPSRTLSWTLLKAQTFFDRHTLLASLRGGVSLGDDPVNTFTLGGLLRLSGLGRNQMSGSHYGLGSLVYYYRLSDGGGFFKKCYLGGSFEAGNVWSDRDDYWSSPLYAGSGFLGIDTFLGPVYIGIGKTEGTSAKGYFYLGVPF